VHRSDPYRVPGGGPTIAASGLGGQATSSAVGAVSHPYVGGMTTALRGRGRLATPPRLMRVWAGDFALLLELAGGGRSRPVHQRLIAAAACRGRSPRHANTVTGLEPVRNDVLHSATGVCSARPAGLVGPHNAPSPLSRTAASPTRPPLHRSEVSHQGWPPSDGDGAALPRRLLPMVCRPSIGPQPTLPARRLPTLRRCASLS
jgi:hypothetical protein